MTSNPNDPKELECQLKAKAAFQLQEEIIKDLECEDKSLAELIGEETDEDKATKDDSGANS
tara:strand:+ start:271 stop:453 length:183 start_codon:yes stop_codon:yes gene_type:complete